MRIRPLQPHMPLIKSVILVPHNGDTPYDPRTRGAMPARPVQSQIPSITSGSRCVLHGPPVAHSSTCPSVVRLECESRLLLSYNPCCSDIYATAHRLPGVGSPGPASRYLPSSLTGLPATALTAGSCWFLTGRPCLAVSPAVALPRRHSAPIGLRLTCPDPPYGLPITSRAVHCHPRTPWPDSRSPLALTAPYPRVLTASITPGLPLRYSFGALVATTCLHHPRARQDRGCPVIASRTESMSGGFRTRYPS